MSQEADKGDSEGGGVHDVGRVPGGVYSTPKASRLSNQRPPPPGRLSNQRPPPTRTHIYIPYDNQGKQHLAPLPR